MSPAWRPTPVTGIRRRSSCLIYAICTKPKTLAESAKKLTGLPSGRPKTCVLSSRVFFGARYRHRNGPAFGVLYLSRLNRLPCCPVAQIQRCVVGCRDPLVFPLAQGNNHQKQIPTFPGKPVLEPGAVFDNIYFLRHAVVHQAGQAVTQDIWAIPSSC